MIELPIYSRKIWNLKHRMKKNTTEVHHSGSEKRSIIQNKGKMDLVLADINFQAYGIDIDFHLHFYYLYFTSYF